MSNTDVIDIIAKTIYDAFAESAKHSVSYAVEQWPDVNAGNKTFYTNLAKSIEKQLPKEVKSINRVTSCNERGARIAGVGDELVRDIRFYDEGGLIQMWVEVAERGHPENTHEAIQYFLPEEAMAFSKAFRRCAIAALDYGS